MGWWSCTVCGGDEPLDYLGAMEDLIGLPSYDVKTGEDKTYTLAQRRDAVNNNIDKLVAYAERQLDDSEISYQVLGVIIIGNGAKLTAKLRDRIVQAIKADEWAMENKERKVYMNAFKRQIKRYPLNQNARCRTIAYEGLFDKIAEKMAKGESGLVNK